jgi:hypothetical protein
VFQLRYRSFVLKAQDANAASEGLKKLQTINPVRGDHDEASDEFPGSK